MLRRFWASIDANPRSRARLWLENDLNATVLLVAKRLVRLRRIGQRKSMGDQKRWIDFIILDLVHQRLQIPVDVRLAGFHCQRLVYERAHRHLVE